MKFKTGDVVNFNWEGGLFSKLIRYYNIFNYGESTATHSGIISKVTGSSVWIHEAIDGRKKEFGPYEYSIEWMMKSKEQGIITIRRPTVSVKKINEICMSYEDFQYDWISILLMPFTFFKATPNSVFCSEAVARILYDVSDKKLNIAEELEKDYEKISPMDLQITSQLKTI